MGRAQQADPTVQAEGYEVIAAQYGLDTNEADVAATRATLGRVHSPASWSATPTEERSSPPRAPDRVAGLVYISALGPDETETSQSEQEKFPTNAAFGQIEVADGRVWLKPVRRCCFCGDLPEEEQSWSGRPPTPRPSSCSAATLRAWLEDEAELVHRGQQRPGRAPRPGAIRGQADGCHYLRDRQQPRSHAVPSRFVLDVIRTAATSV